MSHSLETVTHLPARPSQVAFNRLELDRILSLYGRMVAAGQLGRKTKHGFRTY